MDKYLKRSHQLWRPGMFITITGTGVGETQFSPTLPNHGAMIEIVETVDAIILKMMGEDS